MIALVTLTQQECVASCAKFRSFVVWYTVAASEEKDKRTAQEEGMDGRKEGGTVGGAGIS